jgi:predicted dienelactone hydrolase
MTLAEPNTGLSVWYPAASAASRARRARYRSSESATLRERLARALIRGDALEAPPARPGPHPLLLYAPGWNCGPGENTVLAQDLASHGFVVAALDNLGADAPLDFSSAGAADATRRRLDEQARRGAAFVGRLLDGIFGQRGADLRERIGELDPHQVAMFGFSFGGAVAAETARRDSRIRAAANLDGWLFADAAEFGVPRPFLMIVRGKAPDATRIPPAEASFAALNATRVRAGFEHHGGYLIGIEGTNHLSFTDAALLPALQASGAAEIGGRRLRAIIGAHIRQFFTCYARDRETAMFGPAARSTREHPHRPLDPAIEVKCWRDPGTG